VTVVNIAFLAHDKKKELMVQFCTAYKSVLMKHNLFATATTGRLIADNTGLPITLLLSHKQGGHQQINARIAYNEIDLVLLFTDPNTTDPWDDDRDHPALRPAQCSHRHQSGLGGNAHHGLAAGRSGLAGNAAQQDPLLIIHTGGRYGVLWIVEYPSVLRPATRYGEDNYGDHQAPDAVRLYGAAAGKAAEI
jgi:methylglyoxal synthase